MTIDRYAWAYRRNARLDDFLSMEELIGTLVVTVSCGGFSLKFVKIKFELNYANFQGIFW
jgi:hypothetical protein